MSLSEAGAAASLSAGAAGGSSLRRSSVQPPNRPFCAPRPCFNTCLQFRHSDREAKGHAVHCLAVQH